MTTFDVNNIQLEIQSPGITIDGKLENKMICQIEKLGKKFPRITKCELIFKNEKSSRNKECVAEARLFVPGEMFFTKQQESSFELASGKMFDDLEDQLLRFKERKQA